MRHITPGQISSTHVPAKKNVCRGRGQSLHSQAQGFLNGQKRARFELPRLLYYLLGLSCSGANLLSPGKLLSSSFALKSESDEIRDLLLLLRLSFCACRRRRNERRRKKAIKREREEKEL